MPVVGCHYIPITANSLQTPHCCLPLAAAVRLSRPWVCELRAWAGSLCTSPSEWGLEVHVPTGLLPGCAEGEWRDLLGSQAKGSEGTLSCPAKALCMEQSPGSARVHHLALVLFLSFSPKPEFSPSEKLCSSLKEWLRGIWK